MPQIRNYDPPTYSLTRVKSRDASASKKNFSTFNNAWPFHTFKPGNNKPTKTIHYMHLLNFHSQHLRRVSERKDSSFVHLFFFLFDRWFGGFFVCGLVNPPWGVPAAPPQWAGD